MTTPLLFLEALCKSQKGYSALLESFRILTKAFTDTPLIFSLFSFYFENILLLPCKCERADIVINVTLIKRKSSENMNMLGVV